MTTSRKSTQVLEKSFFFFVLFCWFLVSGRKQVDVMSSQSVGRHNLKTCVQTRRLRLFETRVKIVMRLYFFLLTTRFPGSSQLYVSFVGICLSLVIKVAAKEVIQQQLIGKIKQVTATVSYSAINQPAVCCCP